MRKEQRERLPDHGAEYDRTIAANSKNPGPTLPGAYQPVVSFDKFEMDEMKAQVLEFLGGDINKLDDYIKKTSLGIWLMLGAVAMKDVKGRNGAGVRINASKAWFEMAKSMQKIVEGQKKQLAASSEE